MLPTLPWECDSKISGVFILYYNYVTFDMLNYFKLREYLLINSTCTERIIVFEYRRRIIRLNI